MICSKSKKGLYILFSLWLRVIDDRLYIFWVRLHISSIKCPRQGMWVWPKQHFQLHFEAGQLILNKHLLKMLKMLLPIEAEHSDIIQVSLCKLLTST